VEAGDNLRKRDMWMSIRRWRMTNCKAYLTKDSSLVDEGALNEWKNTPI